MEKKELILIASICTLMMVGAGVYLRQNNQAELSTEVSNLYCRVYGDQQSCNSSGFCSWKDSVCRIDCSVNRNKDSCNQYAFCYFSTTGMGGACSTLCEKIDDYTSCNNSVECQKEGLGTCFKKSGNH